jgi:Bacterial PH domain
MPTVYRSPVGRLLTVVIGLMCAVVAVATTIGGGLDDTLRFAPWLALVAGGCWAMFWRPRVEVSDGGVRIVNVTRTVEVPWPAITGIETRWALTLVTAYGRFTAWAAPASGRGPVRRAARTELAVPGRPQGDAALGAPDVAPGASGEVAEIVGEYWERLKAAGHLDNPVLEHDRIPVHWHIGTFAAGAVLVVLGVVGLMA